MKSSTEKNTVEHMSRKQRELHEREQLILDTAQLILQQQGLQNLTMERVAAEIEYSKGTVYNHFCSKEEIINGISCRCLTNLIELFTRAKNYHGNHRQRIAAIGIAHSLHAELHPAEVQNMQIIKSAAVREKISDEKQQLLLRLEQQITQIVLDIITDAIEDGDIPQGQPFVPDSILLGLWTMGYGSNLLHLSGIPFDKLGIQQPLDMKWINSHKLLDSYQWRPLSSEFDITELQKQLSNELFFSEVELLKNQPINKKI
ncbi:hypothetical protein MNBD_GAMMA09-692 [hydrothermal vent metagenome]|uniref:HTH tetR-type domain-containing protein n=1 Tax=hydrothermal vent metagenome TaxID=652676 RepID=A0A3B0Y7C7_9ZZZZ